MENKKTLNFTDKRAVPCNDRALKLIKAFKNVKVAEEELEQAKKDVPDYTGQWLDEQYYQDELQNYYDACAELEAIIFPDSK